MVGYESQKNINTITILAVVQPHLQPCSNRHRPAAYEGTGDMWGLYVATSTSETYVRSCRRKL